MIESTSNMDQILSWQEKLFMKGLTGETDIGRIPIDIDQSVNYITDHKNGFLTEYEEEAIRLHYEENLGVSSIASRMSAKHKKTVRVSQANGMLSQAHIKLRHPKCMRYMLLGVSKARSIEKKREDYNKQIEKDETWASTIKDYDDETLRKLLSVRKRIDRIIERNYLTFQESPANEQICRIRIDEIGLPRQAVKSLMANGYIKISDLIGKTEAEVQRKARLSYEELYKLKKCLGEYGITVQ